MTLVWRPGYTTTFADPDVQAYITAVEEADNAALEYRTAVAIDEFVRGCKSDGIWSAIKASCILAGARTLNGALVPLVGTAPINNNFVAGDYNRKTGLLGDGSTKYLDSNRANNADPQNSQHLSVYASTVGSSGPLGIYIGDATSGQTGASYIYRLDANVIFAGVSRGTTEFNGGNNSANTAGFYAVNRGAAGSYLYRTKAASSSVTLASSTSTTGNINVFRLNRSTNNLNTNARLTFYSIGESIDLAALDARVTALITAFGVAIP